ncbi:MAG: AAA family ATPase, partial [Pseudopedobacter sp.]|nr:AAA family ATPase [Deinococcales bacterium]
MRPLKLKLQNFTAFRAPTELDFTPLELYAIEGPTGSGKSSLLDAIIFALYGEVPRLGGKGLDALISTGEGRLTVELEFEVGEERYRVVRTKGRKQAQSEVRFVRLLENNLEQTVAQETKKKDLQAAIVKVLGLSLES